jgi:hypothetical protein
MENLVDKDEQDVLENVVLKDLKVIPANQDYLDQLVPLDFQEIEVPVVLMVKMVSQVMMDSMVNEAKQETMVHKEISVYRVMPATLANQEQTV